MFQAFLVYANGFLSNAGNYKSFGDSKIIPNLPKNKFEAIVQASVAYKKETKYLQPIWNKIKDVTYLLEGKVKTLGLGEKGITTYFSSNCSTKDADLVNEFMQQKGLESYNTRCFKTTENGINVYEIRLASVELGEDPKVTLPVEAFKGNFFNDILRFYVKNRTK